MSAKCFIGAGVPPFKPRNGKQDANHKSLIEERVLIEVGSAQRGCGGRNAKEGSFAFIIGRWHQEVPEENPLGFRRHGQVFFAT